MDRLEFLKEQEKPTCLGCVAAFPRQFGDKVLLADDGALTEGNVPLSLCQMLRPHRSIHLAFRWRIRLRRDRSFPSWQPQMSGEQEIRPSKKHAAFKDQFCRTRHMQVVFGNDGSSLTTICQQGIPRRANDVLSDRRKRLPQVRGGSAILSQSLTPGASPLPVMISTWRAMPATQALAGAFGRRLFPSSDEIRSSGIFSPFHIPLEATAMSLRPHSHFRPCPTTPPVLLGPRSGAVIRMGSFAIGRRRVRSQRRHGQIT
jgi:hypothetical protein